MTRISQLPIFIFFATCVCFVLWGCGEEDCQGDNCDARVPLEIDQKRQAETWNDAGAPSRFSSLGEDYEYRLSQLPTSGMADEETWTGWYWATWRDAINYKWDGPESDSPTTKYARAFGMDSRALEDAVSARHGVDSRENATTCSSNGQCNSFNKEKCAKRFGEATGKCIPTWMGQCHAWAPASVMEPEPKNSVTFNGVTFKVQDIKALMTYVYNNVGAEALGGRCYVDDDKVVFDEFGRPVTRECRDINPGSLHVILTNWLGIHKKAFVEDRTWDNEVWNQPVRGFDVKKMAEISETKAAELVGVTSAGGQTANESDTVLKNEWKHFGPFSGSVRIEMTGVGDADLYVKANGQPGKNDYDCRPWKGNCYESCQVTGDEVHVSVLGYKASSDFDLAITHSGRAEYVFNPDAIRLYHVITDIKYIEESYSHIDGNLDEDDYTKIDTVEYVLEVDERGAIVGGEWIKNNPHADFLWVPTTTAGDFPVGDYTFEYAKIKHLLNLSIGVDNGQDEEPRCGNNTVDEAEECDGNTTSCGALSAGYTFGTATCNGNCTWNTSFCVTVSEPTCGDNEINGRELCEQGDSRSCTEIGDNYIDGTAICSDDCTSWNKQDCVTDTVAITAHESETLSKNNWHNYGPFSTSATSDFIVSMTGTGDADLYVRKNSRPTMYGYDCRPWKEGSDESCNLSGAGEYYVSVFGYDQSSTYNLSISYTR